MTDGQIDNTKAEQELSDGQSQSVGGKNSQKEDVANAGDNSSQQSNTSSYPAANRYQAASKVKPEYNVGKQIVVTSLKTILICAFAVFVSILCVYVVNPTLMANICGNLGLKNAEISCLELVYARNKNDTNLYNLVLKLGDNSRKQNDYIEKLQASKSYDEFCTKVDISTIDAYKKGNLSKRYLCYTYGTDEYLNSRIVLNLLQQKKWDDAYNKATENMTSEQNYSCVVYYFAEYMLTDNVTAEQRVEYFTKLLGHTNFDELQNRLEALGIAEVAGTAKILNAYEQVKLSYTIYAANTFGGSSEDSIADSKQAYDNAYSAWQQIVNAK